MDKKELRKLQLPPLEEIMSKAMSDTPDKPAEVKRPSYPTQPENGKCAIDYNVAGVKLAVQGDFEGALAHIDLAIRMAPHCSGFYRHRAEVRRLTGNVYGANLDERIANALEPGAEFIASLITSGNKHSRKLANELLDDYKEGNDKADEKYGPGFNWEA